MKPKPIALLVVGGLLIIGSLVSYVIRYNGQKSTIDLVNQAKRWQIAGMYGNENVDEVLSGRKTSTGYYSLTKFIAPDAGLHYFVAGFGASLIVAGLVISALGQKPAQ